MAQPDELTPREREVLDLVRQGLTNDQIAERMGISSDGVKYHVTQINSKLGVTSRYEAVAAAEGPVRWWQHVLAAPLWRVAGAGVVAATVAGVAVLAWTVFRSDGEEDASAGEMAMDELYEAVTDAVTRDGEILHTTTLTTGYSNHIDHAPSPGEMWVNPALGAIRYTSDAGQGSLLIGDYMLGSSGHGFEEPHQSALCSAPATWLGALLMCQAGAEASVEPAEHNGNDVVAVTYLYRFEPDDPEEAGSSVLLMTSLIYLDPETLLPIESRFTVEFDDDLDTELVATYENEFVPADAETLALFDPRQFPVQSVVPEYDPPGPPKPAYWLGDQFDAGDDGAFLVRVGSGPPSESTAQRSVSYITSEYTVGVAIETLNAQGWSNYQTSEVLEVLDDPECVTVHDEEIGERLFTVYESEPFEYPEPGAQEPAGSCKRRIYDFREIWSGLFLTWETPDGGAVKVIPVFAQRPLSLDDLRPALETLRLYEDPG